MPVNLSKFMTLSQGNIKSSGLESRISASSPSRKPWGTKSRRAYHRILSGLKRQKVLRKTLRFITLTSSDDSVFLEMNANFQALRKRIMRKWGIRFEYWKIKTTEGNGVLHILYSGAWIPQSWLSRNWDEIHSAKIVDIRMVRGEKKLTKYLISQYLADQEFQYYTRQSWSWEWCFRGFVGVWKRVLKVKEAETLGQAIHLWDAVIRHRNPSSWFNSCPRRVLASICRTAPLEAFKYS